MICALITVLIINLSKLIEIVVDANFTKLNSPAPLIVPVNA